MATAKVIAHSFKIPHVALEKGDDGKIKAVQSSIDSPPTLILAKCGGNEVRVSVPVTRREKPAEGSQIEITEPVVQTKARYNEHGRPVALDEIRSANLLTKTTPLLKKRPMEALAA
jgi:hypothetical protein